jgi:dTDP-4-dehydrorhamnose reductase
MRVAVTGAAGQLGKAVVRTLAAEPDDQVVAWDRRALDITEPEAVRAALRDYAPDAVVNCAAHTKVDACEDDPEPAWAVNAAGAANLARAVADTGAFLVHVSTDYVFDGALDRPYTEFDRPNPQSVYGRTKDAGEQLVRDCGAHAIVRAAWLHGFDGGNFVRTMLRVGRERDEVSVVDDQVGTPTFAFDLAPVLAMIVRNRATGTFHVAGTGACTWYELCKEAFRLAGIDTPVRPIDTATFGARAPRPANSRLEGRHARMVGLPPLPAWQESLERLVAGLR